METLEVTLKYPRGSIETATVDIQMIDEADFLGWNYRAWINMAGHTVEFMQGSNLSRDVETWYPFEEHDTYRNAGRAYSREYIQSFAGWREFVAEYVVALDPKDVFRNRRVEGL